MSLNGVVPLGLVLLVCGAQGFFLPNVTHLEKLLSKYQQDKPHSRVRRAIPRSDKEEILMLHNKLRGQVYPPASNMEYMVSAGAPTGAGGLCFCLRGGGGGGRLGVSRQEGVPCLCCRHHSGTGESPGQRSPAQAPTPGSPLALLQAGRGSQGWALGSPETLMCP